MTKPIVPPHQPDQPDQPNTPTNVTKLPRRPRPPSENPRRDAIVGGIVVFIVMFVVLGVIIACAQGVTTAMNRAASQRAAPTATTSPAAPAAPVKPKPTVAPKPTTPPITYETIKTFSGSGRGPEVKTPDFLALDGYRVVWSITPKDWSAPRNFGIHTHYGSQDGGFTMPGPFIRSQHPDQADHGRFILKPGGNLGSLTFLKVYAAGVNYTIEVQRPA